MKVYRYTFQVSFLIVIVFLILSWLLCSSESDVGKWLENISVGVFASALLLVGSSLIGYLVEDEKICNEYYWKLLSLRSKILVLSTIPLEKNVSEEYYNAIAQINELLIGYFAMVEQKFIFWRWRKKIQKLFEIHAFLHEYENLSESAEIHFREYIAAVKDENGKRRYTREDLHRDIMEFCKVTDNYKETGQPFVVFLDLKIREYHALLVK